MSGKCVDKKNGKSFLNRFDFLIHKIVNRLGADDDPEPERHPCPDFFDTCCTLKSEEHVKEVVRAPIPKTDKCGIRNKKGSTFTLVGRENEAQFGELEIFLIFRLKFLSFHILNISFCICSVDQLNSPGSRQ